MAYVVHIHVACMIIEMKPKTETRRRDEGILSLKKNTDKLYDFFMNYNMVRCEAN